MRRVNQAQPRTVVVVNAGAPVLMPWLDEVPAVLLCWFPGQEAGNALADVLFGAAEPGDDLIDVEHVEIIWEENSQDNTLPARLRPDQEIFSGPVRMPILAIGMGGGAWACAKRSRRV